MAGAPAVRVLALVPYPVGRVPGQRYRIEQWAPHLQRESVEVSLCPFLGAGAMGVLYRRGHVPRKTAAIVSGYLRRLHDLRRVDDFDVVYVYREAALLGGAWLERRIAGRRPLVLDFDDAIWLPHASAANAWTRRFKRGTRVEAACRRARHVTVGSEHLAEWARAHASEVTVLPSTIDTTQYVPAERPLPARPVVGWTGSTTTLPYLRRIEPALARVRARVDFDLRVIASAGEAPVLGTPVREWRPETEVADLQAIDVGLMPMPDDAWARGKCGMKALQYMALGIPPVVSPVGANTEIVEHDANGLHARDEDGWVQALERLLADPALRKRLGAAARRTVVERYSAAVQVPRVAAVLRAAALAGPR